jgi:hypothetical protein
MVAEKQSENSNLPDIEMQSALFITTKERVIEFFRYIEKQSLIFVLGWYIYFYKSS